MAEQVVATAAAVKLIHELREQYGPLMFHQSGGCCDGSVPLCFRLGEFRVGSRDVLLGVIMAHLLGQEEEEVDYVLRLAREARAQHWVLRGNAHRTSEIGRAHV